MSRSAQLYDLQQIDTGLDSRVARMRLIDEQLASSPKVLAAQAALDEATSRLADEQARLKRASHELEDTSTRLTALEKRLYNGSVKNPKELGQIQAEVLHLRERHKTQEDAVLEAMLAADEAEEAKQARATELEQVSRERQQYADGLAEEKDTLLSQAKVLQVKRQKALAELPWADLQAYERLRRSKAGMAVAGVHDGLCEGCHVGVPAHILRQARVSSELVYCPTCGRILYPLGGIKFTAFNHDLDNIDR